MSFKIAITGGAATGKTTILKKFAQKKVPVFSADETIRRYTLPGSDIYKQIKKLIGPEYFDPKGNLRRKALLKLIIKEEKTRKKLEELLHPLVKKELFLFWKKHKDSPLIIAEIPLLFEVGWEKYFDFIILVYTSPLTQLKRLEKRLGDLELAKGLLKLQWPLEKKISKADLIVWGEYPLNSTDIHRSQK